MAMAGKQLQAQYGKDGFDIIGHKIWCFTGDGCIQEGVGQEGTCLNEPKPRIVLPKDVLNLRHLVISKSLTNARDSSPSIVLSALSIAGHFGLDNLILIYDNNRVTVDGTIDNCFTDDTSAKLAAVGFHVIEVYDGSNDLASVIEALQKAKTIKVGKPILVNIRTVIGFSSRKQNTGAAHGAALGAEEVEYVKEQLGFGGDGSKPFHIPDEVYQYFSAKVEEGAKLEEDWEAQMKEYKAKYPEEEKELRMRLSGKWMKDETLVNSLLPTKAQLPQDPQPTRKASGIVVQALVPGHKNFIAGSADLMESTFVSFPGQLEFQNVRIVLNRPVTRMRIGPALFTDVFFLCATAVFRSRQLRWQAGPMGNSRIRNGRMQQRNGSVSEGHVYPVSITLSCSSVGVSADAILPSFAF